jgi:hypothetical protein
MSNTKVTEQTRGSTRGRENPSKPVAYIYIYLNFFCYRRLPDPVRLESPADCVRRSSGPCASCEP